jgi:hypothetical protein
VPIPDEQQPALRHFPRLVNQLTSLRTVSVVGVLQSQDLPSELHGLSQVSSLASNLITSQTAQHANIPRVLLQLETLVWSKNGLARVATWLWPKPRLLYVDLS